MAVGRTLVNGAKESESIQQSLPSQMLTEIARPLKSARLLPQKRPLEATPVEQEWSCEYAAQICRKAPSVSCPSTSSSATAPPRHAAASTASKQKQLSLDEAVAQAKRLFTDAYTAYALDIDLRGTTPAQLCAEAWARDNYVAMKEVLLSLLAWTGKMNDAPGGYKIIKFQGIKGTRYDVSKTQLQRLRKEGPRAKAWEALCAVLAAISSRSEKIWLECHDLRDDIKTELKKITRCSNILSSRRRDAIRKVVPKLVDNGAGFFASYLIDPRAVHHVTFAQQPHGLLPATSMIIRRMPLWDALKTMDYEGPLTGAAKQKRWCFAAGREFTLQDIHFGEDDDPKKELWERRVDVKNLQPDPQLRDLLCSKTPVILLDTLAALAPRKVCKEQELSRIVHAELANLYATAKAQGEAVVFHVASDDPHKLVQRVYLRKPLADHGMRCGCLRWRESAKAAWAREFRSDERVHICLQMP